MYLLKTCQYDPIFTEVLSYIDYGGDCICILIIVRGLYYGTETSIVILLAQGIWGKSLHDFNIKNICRITTLICFKDTGKYIWQYTNLKIL